MIRRASVTLFLLALAPACQDRIVARVGDYALTDAMVSNRERVSRVFYPDEKSSVGLEQLTRAYVYAQILKNAGRPVTDAILAVEERRIDAQTRDPARLQRIKDIFGRDHEG